ncbi:hypothetical protein F4804DRAFT_316239 [Jackrogersella minutella]|nr:hypothetical protein F4804DRAFT_316239 [Jackrogersella minutella]
MAPVNQDPNNPLGDILDGPATKPPTGVTSNFDNPSNQNSLVRAVLILVLVITSLCVVIRVYSRIILKRFKITDILGLAAFGLYVAFVYLFFKLVNSYGWFVHMWDIRLGDFPAVNQIFFQGLILYFCIVLLIKSAILLEWMTIFVPKGTRNFFFWSSSSVLVIHNLFYISMIIVELAACTPFKRNWNPLVTGKCLDTIGLAVAISAVNLAFDLIIFFLPQKVIWGLQMRTKRKLGISFLFAIGVLACVAAAFRLASSLRFYKSKDTTYTFSGLALWCLAEVTCGFIVFCGPSAPKTVGHLELQELASSLRSWAGTSVRKLASSAGSSKGSVNRADRKRSKSSMSQNGNDSEKNDVTPVPSRPAGYRTSGSNNSITQGEVTSEFRNNDSPLSIVRTTRFAAVEHEGPESGSQAVAQEEYNRQHPWVSSEKGD